MNTNDILVVAGYNALHAYIILPDGLPEIVEHIDYKNDGQTSAPLIGWTDGRNGYRTIAEKIAEILSRYQPEAWGLACPPLLGQEITAWLPDDFRTSLAVIAETEVETVDISNVCRIFDSKAKDYSAHKEHC